MGSKQKRERAEQGIIFRDGKLVNKEEWYAAHPTREMQQAKVDEAVAQVMANKLVPQRYYCTTCRKHHTQNSKVGKEHTNFYLKEA